VVGSGSQARICTQVHNAGGGRDALQIAVAGCTVRIAAIARDDAGHMSSVAVLIVGVAASEILVIDDAAGEFHAGRDAAIDHRYSDAGATYSVPLSRDGGRDGGCCVIKLGPNRGSMETCVTLESFAKSATADEGSRYDPPRTECKAWR